MKRKQEGQWGRESGMWNLSRYILVGVLIVTLLPAAGALGATPIQGDWRWLDTVIRVTPAGKRAYVGTLLSPGSGEALPCHTVGEVIWTLSGSKLTYTGTTPWSVISDCSPLGQGASTWLLSSQLYGQYCTTDPTGERGTLCYTLTNTQLAVPPMDESPPSNEWLNELTESAVDMFADLVNEVGNGWAKTLAGSWAFLQKTASVFRFGTALHDLSLQPKEALAAADAWYQTSEGRFQLDLAVTTLFAGQYNNATTYGELTQAQRTEIAKWAMDQTGAKKKLLKSAREAGITGTGFAFQLP